MKLSLFKFKKTNKKHLSYIGTFLIAALFFVGNYYSLSVISNIKMKLSEQAIALKVFANKLIDFPNSLFEYMNLKKENARLKMELDELKVEINSSENTELELEKLKKSVGLKYSFSNFKVMEKVLGFDKSPHESFMLISVSDDMTKPGQIVISSDGLVGVIFDCNDKVARVMTVCDQKLNVPVKTSTSRLILSGDSKNEMKSQEINEEIESAKFDINIGDVLRTSGDGGLFPADIPVASVTKIATDKKIVTATPLSKIENIGCVYVISPVLIKY
ncbi:cell shape-determining protein MreC [Alphaproteobacteria bacterium]|nr:cell shape-determining protein MreC [Alphaproteobacteria bacterium]